MPSEGLRFTLSVDGIVEMATAVVGFSLHQQHSVPFILDVDIASGLFDLTAEDFLEKKAVLTVWQRDIPQRYVSGIVTEVQLGVNNGWQMRYYLTVSPPEQKVIYDIDFDRFIENGAIIEIHGCESGGDLYVIDSISKNLSEELPNGYVIGHLTKANPNIGGTTVNEKQDYRHGQRAIWKDGKIIKKTTKEGWLNPNDFEK